MRKHFVIITQRFTPEPCAASHRTESFCRALLESGHDVTVVTGFPTFGGDGAPPERPALLHYTERRDGMRIERIGSWKPPIRGGRVLGWMTLAVGMTFYVLTHLRRTDTIVLSLPHVPMALPALALQTASRARLLVDVRDVYPDIAVAMGKLRKGGLIERAITAVMQLVYRRADLIVAVTPTGAEQIMARGVPAHRLALVPNTFDRVECGTQYAKDARRFEVVFAGNFGVASNMEVILDAAELLLNEPRYQFTLIGEGALAPYLKSEIGRRHLTNVELRGPISRKKAIEVLSKAGAALVTLRSGIVDSIPTKIFDAFCAGTPVIACASGEARRFLEQHGGGLVAEPCDANALAGLVKLLAQDEPLRKRLVDQANQYLRTQPDRLQLMRGLVASLA